MGDVRKALSEDKQPLEIDYTKDSLAFSEAHQSGYLNNYQDFLDSFPTGPYSEEARFWIGTIEKSDSLKQVYVNSKIKIPSRNLMIIEVTNSMDSWKIRDQMIPNNDAPEIIKEFLLNPSKKEIYSKTPNVAIISINFSQTQSELAHDYFIAVRKLYESIYNDYSNYHFGVNYSPLLPHDRKKLVHEKQPFHVVLNGITLPPKPKSPPRPVIN
ncbi:hypothetical protein GCM10007940_26310 [Portibacter lacus]|uniref:Uncharacterized protein n=1 Tax=Portibacter lacus TaxID=1099794 RepID=A0AA37SNP8_9BACT|nr:hypothetical protein GCM10007940_26310 [Portibacter lacus]